MNINEQFKNLLKSFALSDALGYAVEFEEQKNITPELLEKTFSRPNLTASDDTQLSIFMHHAVMKAINAPKDQDSQLPLKSQVLENCVNNYIDWYYTQIKPPTPANRQLCLSDISQNATLWARRAPGKTCLSAGSHLEKHIDHYNPLLAIELPINDSIGCGGIMRSASFSLLGFAGMSEKEIFQTSCLASASTHSSPGGYVPSGAFSVCLYKLLNKEDLSSALQSTLNLLKEEKNSQLTIDAITRAITLAKTNPECAADKMCDALGYGWDALSALSLGVFCALTTNDLKSLIEKSINHSGDSDSVAAIASCFMSATKDISLDPFFISHAHRVDLHPIIDTLDYNIPTQTTPAEPKKIKLS